MDQMTDAELSSCRRVFMEPIGEEEEYAVTTWNYESVENLKSESVRRWEELQLGGLRKGPNQAPWLNMQAPRKIMPYRNLQRNQSIRSELKERNLMEMGIRYVNRKIWASIPQPEKEHMYHLIRKMLDKTIRPNTQVRVGNMAFNCHLPVLQAYSPMFRRFVNQNLIFVDAHKCSPSGFVMLYDWMLTDQPLVQREGILEMFSAAIAMGVEPLRRQIWTALDSIAYFCEDRAFMLAVEGPSYRVAFIRRVMLTRVSKFFLTAVSSVEFTRMRASDLCILLRQNVLAVNSEVEIFYAAIRWLNYDWPKRWRYASSVMKCVRYTLIPPWFLVILTKDGGACVDVAKVVAIKEVMKFINDGITFNTALMFLGGTPETYQQLLFRYNYPLPVRRMWIYDRNCHYHINSDGNALGYISYRGFMEYLLFLQKSPRNYFRSYEPMNAPFYTLDISVRLHPRYREVKYPKVSYRENFSQTFYYDEEPDAETSWDIFNHNISPSIPMSRKVVKPSPLKKKLIFTRNKRVKKKKSNFSKEETNGDIEDELFKRVKSRVKSPINFKSKSRSPTKSKSPPKPTLNVSHRDVSKRPSSPKDIDSVTSRNDCSYSSFFYEEQVKLNCPIHRKNQSEQFDVVYPFEERIIEANSERGSFTKSTDADDRFPFDSPPLSYHEEQQLHRQRIRLQKAVPVVPINSSNQKYLSSISSGFPITSTDGVPTIDPALYYAQPYAKTPASYSKKQFLYSEVPTKPAPPTSSESQYPSSSNSNPTSDTSSSKKSIVKVAASQTRQGILYMNQSATTHIEKCQQHVRFACDENAASIVMSQDIELNQLSVHFDSGRSSRKVHINEAQLQTLQRRSFSSSGENETTNTASESGMSSSVSVLSDCTEESNISTISSPHLKTRAQGVLESVTLPDCSKRYSNGSFVQSLHSDELNIKLSPEQIERRACAQYLDVCEQIDSPAHHSSKESLHKQARERLKEEFRAPSRPESSTYLKNKRQSYETISRNNFLASSSSYHNLGDSPKLIVIGGLDPYIQNLIISQREQLILGGCQRRDCISYGDQVLYLDVKAKKWKHLTHIPFGTRHHHSAVVCNNLVYVIGGNTTNFKTNVSHAFERSIWSFDPKTLKWEMEGSLPEPLRDFAVVPINENFDLCYYCNAHRPLGKGFFIIGGENPNGVPTNAVLFFNVKTRKWTSKPALKVPRYGLMAAIVGNGILVAGGVTGLKGSISRSMERMGFPHCRPEVICDSMEYYGLTCGGSGAHEHVHDEWTILQSTLLKPTLFGKFCTLTGGKLLSIGGITSEGMDYVSMDDISVFEKGIDQWIQIGKLIQPRHGHDVAPLNNTVVVAGGVCGDDKVALKSIEVFCTDTGQLINNIPDLPWPVSGCGIVSFK